MGLAGIGVSHLVMGIVMELGTITFSLTLGYARESVVALYRISSL